MRSLENITVNGMIEERVSRLLEFDKIKDAVARCAASGCGARAILAEEPSFDAPEVKRALSLTDEAVRMLETHLSDPTSAFDDVGEILERADKGSVPGMGELLKVARLLRAARVAVSKIDSAPDDIVLLRELTEGVVVDERLEKDIFDSILGENEMSDRASEKLFGLRRKIANLNIKLKETLLRYTKNNDSSGFLQGNLVTVREGRYVLPVRSEYRSSVPGLIHDRSATGSTVYIEPFAVVELNNELRVARAEEQAEMERILLEFTKRVSLGSRNIALCQKMCTMCDIVFSKARYSVNIRGILPKISPVKAVKLSNSRHPLIAKEKVVPVSIEVGERFSVLLITGPNTGGKTVCLKTVGLFCLLAYFGLFLPCTEASVYVFDGIYCDIGDEQSIENELSTFSSHMTELKKVTDSMTENSLVLLDEVGGGTDPAEGAALAVGILKYIERAGATAVLTTHYGELKEYAFVSDRTENACMQFDEGTLSPTYRLIMGMPGTSNAIATARRLGLSEEIIAEAKRNLGKDKLGLERVLRNAEELKNKSLAELNETRELKEKLEREKAEAEAVRRKLDASLERIRANAAAETKRLVVGAMERANEIVDEMVAAKDRADEAALLSARKLRNELTDLAYSITDDRALPVCEDIDEAKLRPGDRVIVKSLGSIGEVLSVNAKKREAIVRSGAVRTAVAFSDLGRPAEAPKPATRAPMVRPRESASSGFTQREVKVIGLTVSEAIAVIEPYLVSMSSESDAKTLRIVHGKGTGALGKGVQAYLKTCPLVAEYRYGRYGEGDSGVTIVTVK